MKYPFELKSFSFRAPIPAPLRFAFVSDLHDTPNEPILSALSAEPLDAILGGGDFIHDDQRFARGLDFVRRAAQIAPLFCCIGNHELRYAPPDALVDAFSKAGALLLHNRETLFGGVQIGGLTSGFTAAPYLHSRFHTMPPEDLTWLRQFCQGNRYRILLSHHPEYYRPYLRAYPIDLILSGHAHGGQWRFFGQGLFAPGQGFFPKYTSGLYDRRLLVSRGLGNAQVFPRIFNRPQLIFISLTPEA